MNTPALSTAVASMVALLTFESCAGVERAATGPVASEVRVPRGEARLRHSEEAIDDGVAEHVPPKADEKPAAATTRVFPDDAKFAAPDRAFAGRVVDERGEPVAGATVTLVSCWLPRQVVVDLYDYAIGQDTCVQTYPHAESEATTDVAGAFEVRCRDGGDRTLRVCRSGRADVLVDEPEDGCVVRVPDERPTLAVHVVRADDGTPVLGARVRVSQEALGALRPFMDSWFAGATDADGRRRFDDGIACGRAYVIVECAGFAFWAQDEVDVRGGTTSLDVPLSVGHVVEGVVVDDATGAAVSGAHVDGEVTSDGAGRFRAEHQSGDRIAAWTEDRWPWRTADSLGGETAVVVRDGVAADVTIRLRRPAELAVRCVDPTGAPIRGAIVAPSCGGAELTDAQGGVRIGGEWLLRDPAAVRVAFYVDGVRVFERAVAPFAAGETRDLGDVVLAPPK